MGHRPPAYPPLRSARPDPAQPQPRPEAHTPNRISKLTTDSFSSAILAPPTAARPEVAGFPDDQANGNRRTGGEGRGLNRERSRSPSGRVSLGGCGSSRMSELVERFRAVHLALKEPVSECAASRRLRPCQPLSPHARVWTFLEKPPDSAGYSHSCPCSALTPPSVYFKPSGSPGSQAETLRLRTFSPYIKIRSFLDCLYPAKILPASSASHFCLR